MKRMLWRASEGALSGIAASGVVTLALLSVDRVKRHETPMRVFLRELRRVMRGARYDDRPIGVPWALGRAAGFGATFGALGLGKHFPVVSGLAYGSMLFVIGRRGMSPLSRMSDGLWRNAVANLTYGVTLALGTRALDRATRHLRLL